MKMIKALLAGLILLVSTTSAAYDYDYDYDYGHRSRAGMYEVMGRVVAVTSPIYEIVPVTYDCYDDYRYEGYRDRDRQRSLNSGTVLGGVIGGALGSQVGDGRGRDAAIVAGTIVGASIGNDRYHRERDRPRRCDRRYEERIVGYNYIAEYRGYRVHGQTNRRVYLGMRVPMLVPKRHLRRY